MTKEAYVEHLLAMGVLRFGEFETKSGRLSPYFFNTGHIDSGERLTAICDFYAKAIVTHFGAGVENLYGPAYKGIPLAVMTSAKLAQSLKRDISFTFNRKEAKDHGEGGTLVGRDYRGGEKVVLIEDVITGGTSIRESLPLLRQKGVELLGVVVGVDRQEKGTGDLSARREIEETYGVKTAAIVNMDDVVAMLHNHPVQGRVYIDEAMKTRIDAYRKAYGA